MASYLPVMLKLIMLIIFQSLSSVCVGQFVLFVSVLICKKKKIVVWLKSNYCMLSQPSIAFTVNFIVTNEDSHSWL